MSRRRPRPEPDCPPGDPTCPGIRRTVSPRRRLLPPEDVYPFEPWRLVEKQYHAQYLAQMETLFALGNGYLGIRATPEEGAPVDTRGTYLNGFFETWPIAYAEEAYGFPKVGQTMVTVPDGTLIKLYVDDEPFQLDTVTLLAFERALDFRAGTLDRHVRFETADGKELAVHSRRFVSFEHRHLAGIVYELAVHRGEARLVVSSELVTGETRGPVRDDDPRSGRRFDEGALEAVDRRAHELRMLFNFETRASGLRMACAVDHRVECDAQVDIEPAEALEDRGRVVFLAGLAEGQRLRIVKLLAYHHSHLAGLPDRADPGELRFRANRTLDAALRDGIDGLLEGQRRRLDRFWDDADVEVDGDPETQQTIRYNLFQIHQATARAEGFGVPAKGVTGLGYDGHYFWDTEIYVLPFLVATQPQLARAVLQHRYTQLDHARQRAREVSQRGALFPWRTIDGREASAYYAASTAQYHINADIVFAASRYVALTGDLEFLAHGFAEIAVETARLWQDLGFYSPRHGGAFCINGVTGPDEYNTVVNNNAFTNLMARENLLAAIRGVELLRARAPDELRKLERATGLDPEELDRWRRAAERMYVPYDEKTGVHLQDDDFLERKPWDFANTPADHYPLLLHYHPLVIYRHQVIKQADLVLATFLLPEAFTPEERKRIFDYYDPLTTGDSSLSVCIQSIVAAELGYRGKAWRYFADAAAMDLGDIGGNVREGLHVAALGGTWMALVHGFAGLRDRHGELRFRPYLPDGWTRMRFRLRVRGQRLEVEVRGDAVAYRLLEGDGLQIEHAGERLALAPGAPVRRPLPQPPALDAPETPGFTEHADEAEARGARARELERGGEAS